MVITCKCKFSSSSYNKVILPYFFTNYCIICFYSLFPYLNIKVYPSPNYDRSSYGLPMQYIWPFIKKAILSHKLSASSIVWVVNTTELYLNYTPNFRVRQRNLLAIGSTPVLGSSKNYIPGPPISASLTQSFLLLPPESLPAYLLTYSSNYIVWRKYSTDSSRSFPERPFILPKSYRCSFGVKFSHRQSN